MANVRELVIDAKQENLDQVLDFVESALDTIDCPMKPRVAIAVAVEEIFVNIAHYAYKDGVGSATIRLTLNDEPKHIGIEFIDRGVAYDPFARPDPDTTLAASERQIGGLGIFMVKKTMDETSYAYQNGENHLFLFKNL